MNAILLFITIPLTIFTVLFAVSNPQEVEASFAPFLSAPLTASLGAVAVCMMGAGFFLGALFVWMHTHKARFEHWKQKRHVARLEKELSAFRQKDSP